MDKRIAKALCMMLAAVLLAGTIVGIVPAEKAAAAAAVNVTVTHPKMNTIKLSWNKVSGASGYNIYYSTAEAGTYERVSSISDTSVIFDDLETDKYYYFKVVAYTISGGSRVELSSSGTLKVRSNRIGIDVSKWQGTIDWNKVKADGIEFAFVRVACGTNTKLETRYKENIEGAKKAGIPVGVYIYSTATTTAKVKEEARYVLSLIKGFDIDYPVVFDIEEDTYHRYLPKSTNTKLVTTFFDMMEDAGYEAALYTGCSFSQSHLTMSDLKEYDWWIPHYGSNSSYVAYNGKYHFKAATDSNRCAYHNNYTRFWQYTQCGKVNGISGRTDMNYELHLEEETTAVTYVDLASKKETYVAESGETIASIAKKLGIGQASILELNPGCSETGRLAEGTAIAIDTFALTAPSVTVKAESASSIRVSYGEVSAADGYNIYYSTSKTGTYKKLITTSATYYVHKNLSASNTYYYKVEAYRTVNGKTEKMVSAIAFTPLRIANPQNVTAEVVNYNTNKISWSKVAGATGYKLYSSTEKYGTYKLIKTTTANSYSHTKLAHKTRVYYKVKAYVKGSSSDIDSSFSSRVSAKPAQPSVSEPYVSKASTTSITLKFTKAPDASYYKIYRATSPDGTYKKVATITTNSFKNTGLSKNKTYYYKVRAYRTVGGKDYASYYSDPIEAYTASAGPKIKTIEGMSRRVYMTWESIKGVSGYEIYRATSPGGTYKLVTSKSAAYVNNTGLAGNTKYYYKVRYYKLVNKKKVFSAYSEIKSVKTLK